MKFTCLSYSFILVFAVSGHQNVSTKVCKQTLRMLDLGLPEGATLSQMLNDKMADMLLRIFHDGSCDTLYTYIACIFVNNLSTR